ncbi:hypothetical protein HBI55_096330 [Parastagonospora nodorum]|nr:hypothetical protein HBI09_074930 [Parastagonospora nodorum]KAH4983826.1 hypothetical protein HBI76_148250 [Parastagonospora nodorum]KAH5079133.1 hypothetical protein HBH95_089800 [Parastagonospora nodorum]KAH5255339.1 hypothetical protein HBI71_134270 [Parastagonospora nodorum]KAH5415896.1 hypothetical protein HBI46_126920 [Parastagonospora nodorum]
MAVPDSFAGALMGSRAWRGHVTPPTVVHPPLQRRAAFVPRHSTPVGSIRRQRHGRAVPQDPDEFASEPLSTQLEGPHGEYHHTSVHGAVPFSTIPITIRYGMGPRAEDHVVSTTTRRDFSLIGALRP